MASSRMSWAEGSSSRSRPETIADTGLIRSWHRRPARWAASSAWGTALAGVGATAMESEGMAGMIVLICYFGKRERHAREAADFLLFGLPRVALLEPWPGLGYRASRCLSPLAP